MQGAELVLLFVAISIPITIVAVIVNRIWTKKGMSVRVIQFTAVALGIPTIFLLASARLLDGAVVGTLLGGIFGYLLSNISNYDQSRSEDPPANT